MSSFQIPVLDLAQKPNQDSDSINSTPSSAGPESIRDNLMDSSSQMDHVPSILSSPWHIESRSTVDRLSDESSNWLLFPSGDNQFRHEVLSGNNIDSTPCDLSTTTSNLTEGAFPFADNFSNATSDRVELAQRRNATNQRIESWRQEQVRILLGELSGTTNPIITNHGSGNLRPFEARDLLRKWDLESLSTDRKWRKCTKIEKLYGDYVIRGYSGSHLKEIKTALNDLATYLKDSLRSPPKVKVIKHEYKRQRNRHSDSQFMNNPSLQKCIPIYLKGIIVESNLFYDFQTREADGCTDKECDTEEREVNEQPNDESVGVIPMRRQNFWETDSVDSSQFTTRSESIVGF